MTVSDVLKLVLKNISREDVLKTNLFDSGSAVEPTTEQSELAEDLTTCLNDTIQSIVYVYLPLKKVENITVSDEVFDYANLSETLIDVFKLKDENGVQQKFTTFPSFFKCANGNYTITYSYAPDVVTELADDLVIPEGKVNERVLATGCTSRFYLKRGMYQDANVWDVSFQRFMLIGKRPKHIPEMSSRGWY